MSGGLVSTRAGRFAAGGVRQDPAVAFLLLLPLAAIHLSGWRQAGSGAFGFVLRLLERLGPASGWLLAGLLLLLLLWSIGRIRLRKIPWRQGGLLLVLEGVGWGLLLRPALAFLSSVAPVEGAPLALAQAAAIDWHAELALAAGAGLYEEVLFRAGLFAGLRLLLLGFFRGLGWHGAAPVLALCLGLVLSAAAFSVAHAWGDAAALAVPALAFRFFAGLLLGLIWHWRGLAVVAYAHAAYDALLIL